jgi:uridine kinase
LKVLGVAGGSGSGKTTFAQMLAKALGDDKVLILAQDSYYRDQSAHFDHDGGSVNFDHPDAIDWPLMCQHLDQLRRNHPIEIPIYDFATHKRKTETVHAVPKPYVVVDGILIYVESAVRDRMDYKVYIQTAEDVRFERRLRRDVVERGRTEDGVRAQIAAQVKPMHDEFVEPTAELSDAIISGEKSFAPLVDLLIQQLSQIDGFLQT